MKLDDYTLSVQPGEGLVGRFPSAVLLMPEEAGPALDRLIGVFTEGGDVAPRLEALFGADEPVEFSPFAAVVNCGDGLAVYLHGPLEVAADGPSASFHARGPEVGKLQRYDAPDDVGELALHPAGEQPRDGGVAVRSGLVSGSGLVLKQMAAAVAAAAPASNTIPAQPLPMVQKAAAVPPPAAMSSVAASRPVPAFPHAVTPAPHPVPPPAWQQPATPTAAKTSDAPNPSYGTRIAARLISSIVVGGAATALLSLVLPVGFATFAETYLMTFVALGLLTVLGVVLWDPIYQLLQRRRAAGDWPRWLFVAQAVPETALVFGVQSLLLPGEVLVGEVPLLVDAGVVALLIGAGVLVLEAIPGTRRLLHRGTKASAASPQAGAQRTTDLPGEAVQAAVVAAPLVWGIHCRQGHFNRPDARYCATCGAAMHGLTHEPRQGPRPQLGYLIGDDGVSSVLDHDLVLGRSPQVDQKVRDGRARPLALDDGTGLLGDAHADIVLDGWDVTVVDRGLAQGTQVCEPDSATWIKLAPGQAFPLVSGSRVRLGTRELTFHAANVH